MQGVGGIYQRYYSGDGGHWSSRWLLRAAIPAAWLYGRVALWRRNRHRARAERLEVPVVSIGNITCGGTGKTPTVEMVARDLLARGCHPAIVSRGYGAPKGRAHSERRDRGGPESAAASNGASLAGKIAAVYDPREHSGAAAQAMSGAGNDELRILAANLPSVPHYQARERFAAATAAVSAGADSIILDDGFQHARLHRDFDFVLVDATFPFGGGRTLPSGLLREPLEVLAEADLIGVTRCDLVEPLTLSTLTSYLRSRFPEVPRCQLATEAEAWQRLSDGERQPLDAFQGQRVLGVCGIGNPEAFRRQLLRAGVELVELICFRDHHRYTERDIAKVLKRAETLGVEAIVLTQKDAVKLNADGLDRCWFLSIRQRIVEGRSAYDDALERFTARVTPAANAHARQERRDGEMDDTEERK